MEHKTCMSATRRRKTAGFTFTEAIVGIFIVALSAAIYCSLLPMAFKTGKMVGNSNQASSLVQHKIDQMRGVGWGRLTYKELSNAGIVDASPNAAPFNFKTVDNLSAIYVTPTATIDVADYNTEIKKVTVTLTWSGSANKQGNGTITAMALIAKG